MNNTQSIKHFNLKGCKFVVLFLLLIFASSFAFIVYASDDASNWIDETNIKEPNRVDDTFYIYTAEELAWVSYKAAVSGTTFSGRTIKLMADIDLSGHQWTPIGGYDATLDRADDSRLFKGDFDGNHFVIKGLTIGTKQSPYEKQYAGLIGLTEYGEIRNVHLRDVSIWSNWERCGGIVGETNWIVRNCSVTGIVNSTDSMSGTVIGYMYVQGCLENSWSSATFSGTRSSQSGGLVGYQRGNIYNCFYIGNSNKCGAISGYRQEGNVENCFWANDIGNTLSGTSSSCVDLSTSMTSDEMKTTQFVATLNENGNIEWSSWNISDKSIYPYHDSSLDKDRFWKLSAEAPIKNGDIYEIYTPEQLAWLGKETGNNKYFAGWTFKIMQDIDLGGKYWTPAGEFRGTLDGNGNRILNLKIKTVEMGGLFNSLSSAKVSKLSIENAEVVSKYGDWSGILACIISNSSVIEECMTSGKVCGRTYDFYGYSGGITGYLTGTSILKNCYSTADVSGYCASGIAGRINGSSMQVKNCYATGNLSGMNCYGIAPLSSSEKNQNCYWLKDADHISDGLELLDSEKKGISGASPETYNIIGLSYEEMCDSDNYNDWDFENVWNISEDTNNGLPHLKWESNQSKPVYFIIKYDTTGSDDQIESTIVEKGNAAVISNAIPTRENYTFLGWSTDKKNKQNLILPSDEYNVSNSTTLYAQWSVTVGGSITGEIISFGDESQEIILTLSNTNGVVDSQKVIGNQENYTFEDISEGTYILRVSKSKHCTREYEVVVSDSDVSLDLEIWLYGDVNADGTVNHIDVLQINRNIASQTSVFDAGTDELKAYRFNVANVTAINGSDTELNHIDVLQINRKIANLTSIFDSLE